MDQHRESNANGKQSLFACRICCERKRRAHALVRRRQPFVAARLSKHQDFVRLYRYARFIYFVF
jgi:hypothetical protein